MPFIERGGISEEMRRSMVETKLPSQGAKRKEARTDLPKVIIDLPPATPTGPDTENEYVKLGVEMALVSDKASELTGKLGVLKNEVKTLRAQVKEAEKSDGLGAMAIAALKETLLSKREAYLKMHDSLIGLEQQFNRVDTEFKKVAIQLEAQKKLENDDDKKST